MDMGVLEADFSEVSDIDDLTERELRSVMLVSASDVNQRRVEVFLRRLFVWAITKRASDIHIEGRGDNQKPSVFLHVRNHKGIQNYMYAGEGGIHFQTKLFNLTNTPQGATTPASLTTRFSIALPQSYAAKHGLIARIGSTCYEVDVRVEYIKTFDGFSFVCRLLDQQRTPGLHELNLTESLIHTIYRAIEAPSGLVIASGPTGSGKTTLLNAILGHLNDGQRSIITIENPVEFRLRGNGPIKQIPVTADFTFARALKSVLRADPDVILVGEINDEETMKIAVDASKTGHLVLSTIHTNSAHETISRCVGLGADPASIADTVKLVLAQRLLPVYPGEGCVRDLTADERHWLGVNGMDHIHAVTEPMTSEKSGYVAAIEAVEMDYSIKRYIRDGGEDSSKIYALAREQDQYESLAAAGVRSIERFNCRLSECISTLQSNTEARAQPCRRIRLSREHQISLDEVSQAFDGVKRSRDLDQSTVEQEIQKILEGANR
jgi:type II secretory ATPase GspE/PulE/Tfp pilus assembly ATPase PilB-like protein